MNEIVMSRRFLKAFNFTKENEGGFVDDARDKGGATIYGVSSKWFPDVYKQLIESEPQDVEEVLKAFYYTEFWDDQYDLIFFEPLSIRLFDLSVNISKRRAVKLLQRTFNDLSQTKITEDGKFGAGTLRAINLPPIVHPNFYLSYLRQAENYYKSLSDFDVFGRGWLNRLNKNI